MKLKEVTLVVTKPEKVQLIHPPITTIGIIFVKLPELNHSKVYNKGGFKFPRPLGNSL